MVTNLVLIYNTKIDMSVCVDTLLKLQEKILIIDNTTDKEILKFNKNFSLKKEIDYMPMNGNVGLPVAYNRGLDKISSEWVIIWDQDTIVPLNYINRVKEEIDTKKYDVILPKVESSKQVISPSMLYGPFILNYQPEKDLIITGINSAMAIKKDLICSVGGYNENLFIDYVDHDLMYRISSLAPKILILDDFLISQNFSSDSNQSYTSALSRFKLYKKDFKIFCKYFRFGLLFFYLKVVYRGIKLGLKYKKISFIFEVIK